MKKILLVFASLFAFVCLSIGQSDRGVAINTSGDVAHPSAILDVESTTKGFLPPRLTESQRDDMPAPAEGLVIYNLTSRCLNFYDGDEWIDWCEL